MNEEEKQAIDWLKEELEDEKKHHNHIYKGILGLYDNGSIEIILNLIKKQQKEIEFYKIQELGYLQGYEDGKTHKQTAVAIKNENTQYELIKRVIEEKDKKIEKLKEAYQVLKDDLEEHRIVYIDTPEFEKKYISKDKLKEIIENHKKFLSNEFSKYNEDDIENRKAIQYASARLSFLLADIYKLGE